MTFPFEEIQIAKGVNFSISCIPFSLSRFPFIHLKIICPMVNLLPLHKVFKIINVIQPSQPMDRNEMISEKIKCFSQVTGISARIRLRVS